MKLDHPMTSLTALLNRIILVHLPELRSLDMGMDYSCICWDITTATVPLTYLRLDLLCLDTLICVMSTPPLCHSLRQLYVKLGPSHSNSCSAKLTSNKCIQMVNLHTFTLVQNFFSKLTIEWADFEILTSSKVMPVLCRANVSIFISTNNVNRLRSSSFFTDHRHVDVHFAFHLINCPQYTTVTQYIPHGNYFHPREIVGAKFVIVDIHADRFVSFIFKMKYERKEKISIEFDHVTFV